MSKSKNPVATRKAALKAAAAPDLVPAALVDEIRDLIRTTRAGVAQAVNSALVLLYWQVGTRIREEVLKNERAEYGKQICVTLSNKLVAEFGRGFGRRNLFQMVRFSEVFDESSIVQTLSAKLSWSHFVFVGWKSTKPSRARNHRWA